MLLTTFELCVQKVDVTNASPMIHMLPFTISVLTAFITIFMWVLYYRKTRYHNNDK